MRREGILFQLFLSHLKEVSPSSYKGKTWWVFFIIAFTCGPSFIRVAAVRGAYSEALWGKTVLPFDKREWCLPHKPPPDELHQKFPKQVPSRAVTMPPTSLTAPCPTRARGYRLNWQCCHPWNHNPACAARCCFTILPWCTPWSCHLALREGNWELTFSQRCLLTGMRCLWVSFSSNVLLRHGKHLSMGRWKIGKKVVWKLLQPGSEMPFSHYWRG